MLITKTKISLLLKQPHHLWSTQRNNKIFVDKYIFLGCQRGICSFCSPKGTERWCRRNEFFLLVLWCGGVWLHWFCLRRRHIWVWVVSRNYCRSWLRRPIALACTKTQTVDDRWQTIDKFIKNETCLRNKFVTQSLEKGSPKNKNSHINAGENVSRNV